MPDQADKLRSMVTTAAPSSAAGDGLPMIVVTGGRAGVGTTTVALNLAAVLADRGERVLLVDGAQQRNEMLEPAGLRRDVEYGLSDVLTGKCAIGEAIVQGPAGVRMLLNRWNPRAARDFSRSEQQRLLTELQSLNEGLDLIVLDAGRRVTSWSQRFWSRARLIVLVTTPDDAAVLDAYAAIKQSAADAVPLPLRLLVNQAESDAAATDAQRRMEAACQRLLSRPLPALPALPRHLASEFLGAPASPRVWEMPNTPFGHAALWLGRAVSDYLADDSSDSCATACGAHDRVDYLGSTARC
jgi:flagellar biosynthesis protein FlhG